MKLFGSSKGGRNITRRKAKQKRGAARVVLRVIIIFAIVIGVLIGGALAYLNWGITTPEVSGVRNPVRPTQNNGTPGGPERPNNPNNSNADDAREDLIFTFLILGTDDSDALTDVNMVARFDANDFTLNVVSIPRDTVANVSWNVKKVNSILPNMLHRYRSESDRQLRRDLAMEASVGHFANLLGFEVDFYLWVDMDAFIQLVDAVGGVEFNVPRRMSHPEFVRVYNPGLQRLSGREAMDIVRFRGFADADIGRIGTQQDFMATAVMQIAENLSAGNVVQIANIFFNYVHTDMSLNDIIWFGREFFKMDVENVNFYTMPGNYNDSINGLSYVTIFIDEWLEMINEKLNPFSEDITRQDVSILTREGGRGSRLIVTDGNFAGNASWGQPGGGGGASSGTTTTPSGSGGNQGTNTPSNNTPATPPSGSGGNQGTATPPSGDTEPPIELGSPDTSLSPNVPPDTGNDPSGAPETPPEPPPNVPDGPPEDPPPQLPPAD